MSDATATFFCSCGSYHPIGFYCDKADDDTRDQSPACGCSHSAPSFPLRSVSPSLCLVHEEHACRCGHEPLAVEESPGGTDLADPPHDREHGGCACSHEHDAPESTDLSSLGEASATRALYRIVNMDCPMEEALIRKKLATVDGITSLEFNLMQRVLTVNHALPSTEGIEAALRSIDMTPEPLAASQGETAVFFVADMCCPTEEGPIRNRLSGMPGVQGLEFNLMRRTLNVRHAPSALPAISEALISLNMGA